MPLLPQFLAVHATYGILCNAQDIPSGQYFVCSLQYYYACSFVHTSINIDYVSILYMHVYIVRVEDAV